MSKTLKPGDRKSIVITNDAPMHVYGGVRGPITSTYYETVEKIAAILSDQAKVAQVTSKGEKINLDFTNFDKDLDPYDDEIDEVLELITCTPDKIIDLEVTKTATISTDVTECTFESLNTDIATVTQDGLVTAVKNGETSIRVSKVGYKTATVPVTVVEQPSVTCTPSQISGLVIGETIQLTAIPEDAAFESEDDAIATVTPEGLVEAVSQGKTKIIVSADGYKSTEVVVMTRNKPVIKCTPTSIEGLYAEDSTRIETEPTGVSFRSESEGIATVTQDGEVTGVAAGSTNIIITKDGYQDATVAVSVKEKLEIEVLPETIDALNVGEETTLVTDPNVVTFKSEDIMYATVNDKGVVRGITGGSTNIIISKEGYKDTIVPVTVVAKTMQYSPTTVDSLQVGAKQKITTEPTTSLFSSENILIATVSPEGEITGVKAGTTNILIKKYGYYDVTIPVTVKDAANIVCTPSIIETLYVGEQATITSEPSEGVVFTSDKPEVAEVTPNGVVTGVKAGSLYVIARKEGYADKKVRVNVKDKGNIQCNPTEVTNLEVEAQTTITTVPTGASFNSEKSEIAAVTQEGVVTGVKAGSTNIIVSKEGYNDVTIPVNVILKNVVADPAFISDLVVGQTQKITATPSNATFRVEAEGVISVTNEGVVEALTAGEGKVIIEAEGYKAAGVVVTTKNAD